MLFHLPQQTFLTCLCYAMLKRPKYIKWVHAFEIENSGGVTWKGIISVPHGMCNDRSVHGKCRESSEKEHISRWAGQPFLEELNFKGK